MSHRLERVFVARFCWRRGCTGKLTTQALSPPPSPPPSLCLPGWYFPSLSCRLRLLAALLLADPTALGYVTPALPLPMVDNTGQKIEFTDVLRRTNSRGTAVWQGRRQGEAVVVKMSSAAEWEAEVLEALRDCETVPTLMSQISDGRSPYVGAACWLSCGRFMVGGSMSFAACAVSCACVGPHELALSGARLVSCFIAVALS